MKKWVLIVSLLLLPIFMGCSRGNKNTDNFQKVNITNTVREDRMDYIEMTEKEIELMSAVYSDIERIQKGKLFSHQREALYELRAGMNYLKEKYPESNLDILTFEPANKFTAKAVLMFQDQSLDTIYTLVVKPSENDYICADTYYGYLIRQEYDRKVEKILSDNGFMVASYTEFPSPMGMEVDINTTVDELIDIEPKVNRNTHLFIEGTKNGDTVTEIQERLIKNRLYGSYTVYFTSESIDADIKVLETKKNDWERECFNCFNIE